MRIAAGLAALAIASAAAADPPPPPSAPPPTSPRLGTPSIIQNPDWAAIPSARGLLQVYPEQAWRKHISGHVVLACEVAVEGWAQNCQVRSETPPGLGFGEAALKFSHSFRFIPMRRDGVPIPGGKVVVPVAFTTR
jgi:TonB family protein